MFAGTPGRMRAFGAVAVAACLAFGVLGFGFVRNLDHALRASRSDAAQLVRVQTIRTSLVTADANASNAFLVGGLEPPDVRAGYTAGVRTAATTIAAASAADGRDGATLRGVNDVLASYTGLVEAARANNRQGFPIGAAYLRQASNTIEQQALPPLARLADAERARVQHDADDARNAQIALIALGAVVLVALVVTQVWLFRRTRRIFNLPLVGATVAVIVVGVIAIAAASWSQGIASKARRGPYRETVALTTARVGAFDAKSAESLTLINRGSGQVFETRFQTASKDALAGLGGLPANTSDRAATDTRAAFDAYLVAHTRVRAADDGGSWDTAVRLATGSGDANRAFATFDSTSARALTSEANRLSDDLRHARTPLVAVGIVVLLAGLGAAVASQRGMARRLREYQ
jgi:hypothetical protein